MATDATGAPTPLGIPKYNTSADAPSGLGFNAAMDALDALIAARVNKPIGVTAGDVPVWNGTTFVRPTGTPDATKFLRGDSSWAAPATATVLDYAEATANAGSTATTAATAQAIITGNAVTYDGSTPVWIEFFAPAFQHTAITTVFFMLYDGATQVGRLFESNSVAANTDKPCYGKRRLTPTAGAHTYSIRAYAAAAGTTTVLAGVSGNDTDVAMFLAQIKAS